jgi:hypothetical protein
MAKRLRSVFLVLAVAATPAGADDLSSRLEELEREAAKRAVATPAAPDADAIATEAAPARPATPHAARLTEIQNRRAKAYRERAAAAARRAAAAESGAARAEPAKIEADRRDGQLYARKAEEVFRPGTAEYQAAYEEWIASEAPAAVPGPEPEPTRDASDEAEQN